MVTGRETQDAERTLSLSLVIKLLDYVHWSGLLNNSNTDHTDIIIPISKYRTKKDKDANKQKKIISYQNKSKQSHKKFPNKYFFVKKKTLEKN